MRKGVVPITETNQRYFFVAKNTQTATGFQISFTNIPHAQASGVTYEETVYYAYRVLADFLSHLPEGELALTAYTLHNLPQEATPATFYSLVGVTPDFDPHKMTTTFILEQAPPDAIRREAARIADRIAHKTDDIPVA